MKIMKLIEGIDGESPTARKAILTELCTRFPERAIETVAEIIQESLFEYRREELVEELMDAYHGNVVIVPWNKMTPAQLADELGNQSIGETESDEEVAETLMTFFGLDADQYADIFNEVTNLPK